MVSIQGTTPGLWAPTQASAFGQGLIFHHATMNAAAVRNSLMTGLSCAGQTGGSIGSGSPSSSDSSGTPQNPKGPNFYLHRQMFEAAAQDDLLLQITNQRIGNMLDNVVILHGELRSSTELKEILIGTLELGSAGRFATLSKYATDVTDDIRTDIAVQGGTSLFHVSPQKDFSQPAHSFYYFFFRGMPPAVVARHHIDQAADHAKDASMLRNAAWASAIGDIRAALARHTEISGNGIIAGMLLELEIKVEEGDLKADPSHISVLWDALLARLPA